MTFQFKANLLSVFKERVISNPNFLASLRNPAVTKPYREEEKEDNHSTGRMNAYMTQSDPVRIDDKILMEAVLEQLPQKQAKRLAQAEGIQFSDVLKLSLEYRCKKALFSNLPLLCDICFF